MSFYNVDADNDSANAIVMKHSMEVGDYLMETGFGEFIQVYRYAI